MSKPFKKLLLNNALLPMNEQLRVLDTTIEDWMKNNSQLDDISVMGLKV